MKRKVSFAIILAGCLTLVFGARLFAQTTGAIRGTVKDPSGAVIPAAKVTVTLEGTGTSRTFTTAIDGSYEFASLPVGGYTVRMQAPGFKAFVVQAVNVTIGHVIVVNATLEVGARTQTVTVEANALQVETTSTQLGAVMNDIAVSQLPLDTLDTYQLLQLQPGVTAPLGTSGTSTIFYGSNQTGAVSVNGGRGRSNNFTVNGGNANDLFVNLPTVQPSPDSIQEFRVLTNGYDARSGRNSGSVVNVVTKSGTNRFHGDVYEYFRNKVLDARYFFAEHTPDLKQNQFGGSLGGPIRKDKTFFFINYAGRRIRRGIPSDVVTVPTPAERMGDFSADAPFAGTLTDPAFAAVLNNQDPNNPRLGCAQAIAQLGGAAPAAGTPYSSIFPSNTIPVSCFDPVAFSLMNQFVPMANVRGTNNLVQTIPVERDRGDQFSVRIDHKISPKQQLSVYYYFNDLNQFEPFSTFQEAGANLPGFGDINQFRFQQINLSHTWTIGPTMINEARFVYMREGQLDFNHPVNAHLVQNSCIPALPQCFSSSANPGLGITPFLPANRVGVPYISVSGGFTIGNNFEGELPQVGNSFEEGDDFTKIIGNHALGFGGDVQRNQFNQFLFFDVSGEFLYTGTSLDSLATSNLFGNYLLGLPDTFGQGSPQLEAIRNTIVGLYAQDSWKIKSNLTLNYGLRWDLITPFHDRHNRIQTFRPGQADTVFPCVIGALGSAITGLPQGTSCSPGSPAGPAAEAYFPLGEVVPGDKGIPAGMTQTYYKSFAPRIGLAWSPGWKDGFLAKLTGGPGKSSIRMGYGIFYNPVEQLVLEQFSAEPPFGGSTFVSESLFNTPFELQSGTQIPNPFQGVLNPIPGQAQDWARFEPILLFGENEPNLRTQYADQYNLTLQRELPSHILFQVGYVGTQGHRLLISHDLNPGNAQTCLDLANMASLNPNSVLTGPGGSPFTCGPSLADFSYFIPPGTTIPAQGLHLPYGPTPFVPGGTVVGQNGITLIGIRPFSSPLCNPLAGNGCPGDLVPVFTDIFAEDTVGNSNYNALEVLVEKTLSRGLQFQAAYTYGHSIDDGSSFEDALNPTNFRLSRADSVFDARHRFVFSYYWQLPIPKHQGFAGKLLNGWGSSGIITFQTGTPIQLFSANDVQLQTSLFFFGNGKPNFSSNSFRTRDPRQGGCAIGTGPTANPPSSCVAVANQGFDPNQFTEATEPLGTFGNVPRTICCGPGISDLDLTILKSTPISERFGTEFRAEFFNAFNHVNFFNPDGNFSDGVDFGRVKAARPPREIQFAFKLTF